MTKEERLVMPKVAAVLRGEVLWMKGRGWHWLPRVYCGVNGVQTKLLVFAGYFSVEYTPHRRKDEVFACCECGCLGNEECGHETYGDDCSLMPDGACPCCHAKAEAFEDVRRLRSYGITSENVFALVKADVLVGRYESARRRLAFLDTLVWGKEER